MYKLHYVVDVDIKGFFDNVNHGKLLKQLWAIGIRDKRSHGCYQRYRRFSQYWQSNQYI